MCRASSRGACMCIMAGRLVPSGLNTQLAPSTHAHGVLFLSFFHGWQYLGRNVTVHPCQRCSAGSKKLTGGRLVATLDIGGFSRRAVEGIAVKAVPALGQLLFCTRAVQVAREHWATTRPKRAIAHNAAREREAKLPADDHRFAVAERFVEASLVAGLQCERVNRNCTSGCIGRSDHTMHRVLEQPVARFVRKAAGAKYITRACELPGCSALGKPSSQLTMPQRPATKTSRRPERPGTPPTRRTATAVRSVGALVLESRHGDVENAQIKRMAKSQPACISGKIC